MVSFEKDRREKFDPDLREAKCEKSTLVHGKSESLQAMSRV